MLAAAFGLAAASPLHADEWTLIDVKARLANDGRVTVVETHDIVVATTGRNVFHEFGRGADQDIVLRAMTRIGPDHEPHPLKKVETVNGPDKYTHYELGHAHSRSRLSVKPSALTYQASSTGSPAQSRRPGRIAAGPGYAGVGRAGARLLWERTGRCTAIGR